MSRGHVRRRLVALIGVAAVVSACTLAPAPGSGVPGDPDELPSGYGTLRQEDVSLFLTSGDLQLMVTPLHSSVTRVTAPDTERRLSALAETYGPPGGDGEGLFLVSFYSERPEVRFVPEDVQLVSLGFRLRPESIMPLTPTWGENRVRQREQQMAVYRFSSSVDLESTLVLAYGTDETARWNAVLPVVQAERARVRARAGLGG